MSEKTKTYKDLIVWQKGIELVVEIYIITSQFPNTEIYGLASQMRRSAVSIPSNLAEGYDRHYTPEFLRFTKIANGSLGELDTQLVISKRIYPRINYDKSSSLLMEMRKMLGSLIYSLRKYQDK